MGFNRRTFLTKTGFGLLTLGLYESGIVEPNSSFNAYAATNSVSTSRKLALLVGINQYSQANHLRGCVTDVELQQELLVYRFGFNPHDILTLTDNQATRETIEIAFQEHLLKQAKKDDIVVVHFSGYGRQVLFTPSSDRSPIVLNSLIPYDGILPLEPETIANDLLVDKIISLGRSLKTNKLSIVLDTSFQNSTPSLCNKLFIRTYASLTQAQISPEALFVPNQLKNNPNFQLPSTKISGLILSGSKEGISSEIVSSNFNAGLFTYSLSEYLWQSLPPRNIWTTMQEIAPNIVLLTAEGQKPNLRVSQNNYHSFLFGLMRQNNLAGNAIVTKINSDNTADLDLVGIPLAVLANYRVNSCFDYPENEASVTKVQVHSLQGNKAKVTILKQNHSLTEGSILRESIRVLPRDLGLNIALDPNLERIEKVDATSTLTGLSEIKSVINLGDDFADYILGKLSQKSNLSKGYSLFSTAGILLPNTLGKNTNEAVSSAILRFGSLFKTLLASKLLHLTFNQHSSLLPVSVSLEINHEEQKFSIYKDTFGSLIKQNNKKNKPPEAKLNNNQSSQELLSLIPVGSKINLKIANMSNKYVNVIFLAINSSGKVIVYFSPEKTVINPQNTISIPENFSPFKWIVNAAKGLGELILICSESPFNETLINLYKFTSMKPDREQIIPLDEPEIIAKTILEDLHKGSNIKPDIINNLTDIYALDINSWASFNFVYKIV